MRSEKIKNLTYISICAALMAVSSWITIPAPIPFTMQTFALFTVLLIFGGWNGLKAVLVYIILGIFGLPVFSGFQSGIGVIFSAAGGFIVGFIFIALIYLLLAKYMGKIPALLLGLILCYIIGALWYYFVYANGADVSFLNVLSLCVLPFIIPDLLKLFLALLISKRIKPLISKRQVPKVH